MTYERSEPVLSALGDATRQAIVARLLDGPRSVGDLAADLPVSRPAVSSHLRILGEARLVVGDARGTRRIYRLDPTGAEALRIYCERFWSAAKAAHCEHVERTSRKEKRA